MCNFVMKNREKKELPIFCTWHSHALTAVLWGWRRGDKVSLLQAMKSGHLTNKDTFFHPKGVQIREVPLYTYEVSRGLDSRPCVVRGTPFC